MICWKIVQDYEGLYEISNQGDVRSLDRKVKQISRHGTVMERIYKGKNLKPRLGKQGYYYVQLSKEGIHKTFKNHRLVAIHFVDGYNAELTVNHKDGNKLNNASNNLEWCSIQDNLEHSRIIGLKPKVKFGKYSPNFKGSIEVIKEGKIIAILNGTKEIKDFGLDPNGVSSVINGRQNTHRNYKFRRLENEI